MSERVANCPNCGAPIKFLWSSAVQTTCEFCHSILVRPLLRSGLLLIRTTRHGLRELDIGERPFDHFPKQCCDLIA